MKTLVSNYYGTPGQNGTSGDNGGPGAYALNIGGPKTGGGHYLPPGAYATGASVVIEGGAGGYGGTGITSYNGGNGGGGGAGGIGVLLGGGTLGNNGTVYGGAGGHGGYGYFNGIGLDGSPGGAGGAGGVGVDFTSGAKLMNHTGGKITGGAGGFGGFGGLYGGLGGVGGSGGVGVSLGAGTLTNAAAITGGAGGHGGYAGRPPEESNGGGPGNGGAGGAGAVGVTLGGGVLTNTAAITGGAGGAGGVGAGQLGQEGSGGAGGGGGSGAYLHGGTLTNHGSITGGVGGGGGYGYQEGVGGSGGTGVFLNGGTVITTASISGGTGGTAADDRIGIISAAGGGGGAGVTEVSGTLTNLGSITGGTGGGGGYGYAHSGGAGGSGGAGVSLSGGTLTTSGSVSGGAGGPGGGGNLGQNGFPATGGAGGTGGAGAYLNGGTLTTSGTISRGAGGAGGTGATNGAAGAAGDAVQFGSVASTLVVKPGAVFNGQVAANASVNDTLRLSGTQSGGTPITLGAQFTHFSTLTFAAGAAWTVDVGTGAASSSGLAITGFTTSDTIDITNNSPTKVAGVFNPDTHVLNGTSFGDGTFNFAGAFSDEYFVFDSDGSGGTDVTLASGDGISTTLTITVALGSTEHPSPLTITSTGRVSPTTAGASGVVSNIAGNSLANHGDIQGGAGSTGSVGGGGGLGASFTAGTLTNTRSITGGAGGKGTTTGGAGGSGVLLNGGTLVTSGTVSGGQGGPGPTHGAAGDAVQFGSVASTLIVHPGAVFNGQVVGNASAHDVLELSGTQSGGTAITLGTEFTNFATLDFASGAAWTADAKVADLTAHPLTIDGFAIGDTLGITNLAEKGTTQSFNSANDVLTLTRGTTVITLDFNSSVTGDHFVLTADGTGTDLTLASGPAPTLAAAGHDLMNFVGDEHRVLMGGQSTFGARGAGSGFTLHPDPAQVALSGHGFSAHALTDHGVAHVGTMLA